MSQKHPPKPVYCVRNHTSKATEEHLSCPYCFGRKREVIEAGERKLFCDFDPDRDPIVFGFPDGSTRNANG